MGTSPEAAALEQLRSNIEQGQAAADEAGQALVVAQERVDDLLNSIKTLTSQIENNPNSTEAITNLANDALEMGQQIRLVAEGLKTVGKVEEDPGEVDEPVEEVDEDADDEEEDDEDDELP